MDDIIGSIGKSDNGNSKINTATAPVMVVENDPDSLMLISEVVKGLGYKVIEASNGSEALEKIAINIPALVFMDIEMPILNGYDATLRLRGMEAPFCNIPVIAVTAYLTNEDMSRYRNAGFNQVISKPFRIEEIQHNLKQHLHTGFF